MHRGCVVVLVWTLVACAEEQRPPPEAPRKAPSWTDLRKATRAARLAKDYRAYRERLLDLFAISQSSNVLYELAGVEARLGHTDVALARLRTFASMGLAPEADLGKEPAFATLEGLPAFAEVSAHIARNRAPVSHAEALFPLPHEELITEDVAYDPASRTFFVSSVRKKKILAIDAQGVSRDFVAEGARGVGSMCGLAAHGERLWATTTTSLPPMIGYAAGAKGKNALLAYDLRSGEPIERIDLDIADGAEHALTDLAVGPTGDAFVSDALGGGVYVVRHGMHRLEPLTPPGVFVSPQTAAPSPDGRRLFVPDYVRGIASVDLTTRATTWLSHAGDVALNGIDGLYLDGTTFYAIQNGVTPPRVVRLLLDASLSRVSRAEVLEQATPGLGEPTHGVVVEGAFVFLANAGWTRFTDEGQQKPDAPADAPVLMRIAPRP